MGLRVGEGLRTGVGLNHLYGVIKPAQDLAQPFADQSMVVDNKNFHGRANRKRDVCDIVTW